MSESSPLENLTDLAPTELLDFLDLVVSFFPLQFRDRLKKVADSLPRGGDSMQRVLELVRSQWKDIVSEDWVRIALTGPSQTGKATLMRAIRHKQVAAPQPIFGIAETPGLEEFLGYQTAKTVPSELNQADLILLVLDGRYQVSAATRRMVEGLQRLDKPILVVLNKMDQVADGNDAVSSARRELGLRVLGVSAFDPASINDLLDAIVATESRALYPLTMSFPEFRQSICQGVVTQSALASGLVGAISIPVSDMLPLTAIQTAMVLKIARAFGFPINRDRARELIPMLAAGTLVREAGHRLRKQFPRHGTLIGVSAAGLWTYALGRASIAYFQSLSSQAQQLSRPHLRIAGESGA